MEEDMMMPNVAPAPMMAGTPMGGNLSELMAPAQAELSPAEMQEAQGALMQIIQIIQMLINQGMSEEEIQQFLAQYGITEEELDQAAAILGVDIDALMAGEQRMPMAEGGTARNVSDRTLSEKKSYSSFRDAVLNPDRADSPILKELYLKSFGEEIYALDEANILAGNEPSEFLERGIQNFGKYSQTPITVAPSVMRRLSDPLAPARIPRTPEMIIFSINNDIENLYKSYTDAVKSNKFEEAQAIADQIDGLQQQIINLQDSKVPPMSGLNMRFGGSATGK